MKKFIKYIFFIVILLVCADVARNLYIRQFGKKITITGSLPKNMQLRIMASFYSPNCESDDRVSLENNAERDKYVEVVYDFSGERYSAEIPLELPEYFCSWKPLLISISANYPGAFNSYGFEQPIFVSTMGIENEEGNNRPLTVDCRWHKGFSYSERKYANIICEDNNARLYFPDKNSESLILDITLDEKPKIEEIPVREGYYYVPKKVL